MSNYNFLCDKHGEIILNLKMAEVKEIMLCPLCQSKMQRIYSPIKDLWKTSGNYNATR